MGHPSPSFTILLLLVLVSFVALAAANECVVHNFFESLVVITIEDRLDGSHGESYSIRSAGYSYGLNPDSVKDLPDDQRSLLSRGAVVTVSGCLDGSGYGILVSSVSESAAAREERERQINIINNNEALRSTRQHHARFASDAMENPNEARIGERKILTILVTSPQHRIECDVDQPRDILFGKGKVTNINDLMKQQSWGKYNLSGQAIGPITIDIPSSDLCYTDKWNNAVLSIVRKAPYNINTNEWDTIYFNYPRLRDRCTHGGQANLNCDRRQSGGCLAWSWYCDSASVAVHELGHNMGLNHAGLWNTNKEGFPWVEYGDFSSYMGDNLGNWAIVELNGPQKALMGWIPKTRIIEVPPQGGTFTILPSGSLLEPTQPQLLKLNYRPYRNTYISYRVAYGSWDKAIPGTNDGHFPSVALHVDPSPYDQRYVTMLTRLSDTPVNTPYNDEISGYTYTLVSMDGKKAVVRIAPTPATSSSTSSTLSITTTSSSNNNFITSNTMTSSLSSSSSTTGNNGGGDDVCSRVVISQSVSNSWSSGPVKYYQYIVTVRNTGAAIQALPLIVRSSSSSTKLDQAWNMVKSTTSSSSSSPNLPISFTVSHPISASSIDSSVGYIVYGDVATISCLSTSSSSSLSTSGNVCINGVCSSSSTSTSTSSSSSSSSRSSTSTTTTTGAISSTASSRSVTTSSMTSSSSSASLSTTGVSSAGGGGDCVTISATLRTSWSSGGGTFSIYDVTVRNTKTRPASNIIFQIKSSTSSARLDSFWNMNVASSQQSKSLPVQATLSTKTIAGGQSDSSSGFIIVDGLPTFALVSAQC
eukprot:TRINITY_DN2587_c0_g3_i1.p1 TRINITY_DN2587_c0_g3~~TRINITY_DN2587_c0_g3_i1.p1  ORF type:complete len:838 (+),score=180.13 TRINITY_DN2587_c0_g3_i1:67-2514(+)